MGKVTTVEPSVENGGEIGTWRMGVLRRRVAVVNNEPSLTKQSFKEICDINRIMARYEKTGLVSHVSNKPGIFEDVTKFGDYKASLDRVNDAQEAFRLLPASLRERFGNSPVGMLQFLADSKNREEAMELGLVKRPQDAKIATPPLPTTKAGANVAPA